MRYRRLSPWRRAPWRALSIASLSVGVAIAAFVLGLAAGSRPMFVSSAASGSLSADIDEGCRFFAGLSIDRNVAYAPGAEAGDARFPPAEAAAANEALDRAVGGIGGLERVTTIYGPRVRIANAADPATFMGQMQFVSRTGFEEHIEVLDSVPEPGVWIPNNISTLLDLHGGDSILVQIEDATVTLPVAGTFFDLVQRRDEFWCSVAASILQEQRSGGPPPPVLLMDEDLLVDTYTGVGGKTAFTRWEFAPPATGWTFDRATRTVAALQDVAASANNRATPLGQTLGRGEATADAASTIQHARRTRATVSSAAGPIALATAGVAMLVLLTAARSWLDRRRREVTVLALRGAGPLAIASKAVLELIVPLVAGAAAGLAASIVLVSAVGPSTLIESRAIRAGVVQVAIALAVAVLASAAVVAGAVRRVANEAEGAAPRSRLLWWEPPVLLLAAGAIYELRRGGPSVAASTDVDSLALLAPFLLLAGGSGLLARMGLSRRALRPLAARLPSAGWLAVRRLTARRLRAIAVVTSAAVAVGVVVFAGSMSASIRATATAKTLLGPGAEQVIRVGIGDEIPADLVTDGHTTVVTRLSESGVIVRGHPSADVLGVDPATFANAAYWDGSFAGRSLDWLLGRLGAPASGPIPIIAVGEELPDDFVLTVANDDGDDVEIEVRVVARADAFPGLGFRQDRPLVVIDRAALAAAGVNDPTEVWTDSRTSDIADRLDAAGVSVVFEVVAGDITRESTVRAQLWTVSYLELIGLAAALVTLAGLGLYFAASLSGHRLGSAVAQRLGMKRRTSASATALEVGAMLVAGWLFGSVLSWLAARLVYTSFDPRPNSPPPALFRPGFAAAAATGAAAVVVALLVSLVIERGAARRTLQGMLRDAE